MSSLKEARQQLLLNNFDGDIDDEEFLLLFDINKSDNLDLPYKNYENFDLDSRFISQALQISCSLHNY